MIKLTHAEFNSKIRSTELSDAERTQELARNEKIRQWFAKRYVISITNKIFMKESALIN